ncbi:MAG TPA: DUF3418 domain-containing protein, partial [Phycisphaerales bacterium]|nr:DUF3418 domain-containing protein [Phycisphaerales bacterium]
ESSDFLTLLRVWEQYRHARETLTSGGLFAWCREHFVSASRMREWGELAHQLRSIVEDLGLRLGEDQPSEDAIHRSLLTGLITNVACREGDGSFDYRAIRGNVVQIFPGSVLFKKGPRWIMAAELVQTSRLYARTVAKVDPAWIEELAGHIFQRQVSDVHMDSQTGEPSAWERLSLSGVVVVPRRKMLLSGHDPAAARKIFVREAIAGAGWKVDLAFMRLNVEAQQAAQAAQAKLRRRDVQVDPREIEAWFDRAIPPGVHDPASFLKWYGPAAERDPGVLVMGPDQRVREHAKVAFDPAVFPDELKIPTPDGGRVFALRYALAPGKEEDGITVEVPLLDLPLLTAERLAWLVPGLVPELVQSLIKTLPKAERARFEQLGPLSDTAASLAGVMSFADGSLPRALSEAADVLYSISAPVESWNLRGLPQHLRMLVNVVDEEGKSLGKDRDLEALAQRLEGRLRKARGSITRAAVERSGLKTWDFGALPTTPHGEPGEERYGVLIDRGDSVELTVVDSAVKAAALTPLAIRRLFAIACAEEVGYYIDALGQWGSIKQRFSALGSEAELRDHLTLIIADRTFMDGQPGVRSREEFEARKEACWGKLSTSAREAGEVVARILEPRGKVAHRLSGGTNRLWAASVADLREQAAYLMPRGFLTLVMWDRLKHYPRYAQAMHDRLFSLREEGSKPELAILEKFEPHWKKFTAWVASAMSRERARLAEQGEAAGMAGVREPRSKSPLPQARRAAPTVNLDAGEWAMTPGNMPGVVAQYRWMLEELRLLLFTPELALGPLSIAEVERAAGNLPATK